MTEKYPFKPGDWIMDEGDFAKVESVFTLYYEPFDIAEEDDAQVGDYKYTVISYHTFCTPRGRVLSSKAQTTYLDVCDWIEPLTPEQETSLEQIKLKKAEALAAWEAKCKEAKECVEIFVNTKKGEAATALYGEETNSEKLRLLTERLAKAGKAMFDPMNRDDKLAKDYFKHAPKIFYTFDKAYATIEAFLDRNKKELGVEDFTELVKNKDENILRIYHKVLGI